MGVEPVVDNLLHLLGGHIKVGVKLKPHNILGILK